MLENFKYKLVSYKFQDYDKTLVDNMFKIIVDYVERHSVYQELWFRGSRSYLDLFLHKWFPKFFGKERARNLGLSYLDWAISLGAYSQFQSNTAQVVKELYLWYEDEYALYSDPYTTEGEPEHIFVDENDVRTKSMFKQSDDGTFLLNKYHPEYIEYLDRCGEIKKLQREVINQKLNKLIEIRDCLI